MAVDEKLWTSLVVSKCFIRKEKIGFNGDVLF